MREYGATAYTYFEAEDEACFNDLCECGHGLDQHGGCTDGACTLCACDDFVG